MLLVVTEEDLWDHNDAVLKMMNTMCRHVWLEAFEEAWRFRGAYMIPWIEEDYEGWLEEELGDMHVALPVDWSIPAIERAVAQGLAEHWDIKFGGPLPQATATALADLARERPT